MGWDKPRSNGMGGDVSRRNDRGKDESLHGKSDGKRITGDHVHFHDNEATVTKDSRKYSLLDLYCSNCDLTRKQKRTYSHSTGEYTYTCTSCGRKS
jgi:hypothetical protein